MNTKQKKMKETKKAPNKKVHNNSAAFNILAIKEKYYENNKNPIREEINESVALFLKQGNKIKKYKSIVKPPLNSANISLLIRRKK